MFWISVSGGRALSGAITVQGAKNSVLPILSACLVCDAPCVLHNCPRISDVDACLRILTHLGCRIEREGHTVTVDPTAASCSEIPDGLMREMRSSIIFLAAILTRCGRATLSFPGGCELGPRPIDLHVSALSQMGMTAEESNGRLWCTLPNGRLRGCEIVLPVPSVGATENVLIAAARAEGRTVIHNAAREPEIADLAVFLNQCGADVRGYGESTVTVNGVKTLSGAEHTVIPDRIAAVTYMAATAVTGGEVVLRDVIPEHVDPVLPFFRQSGCEVILGRRALQLRAPERLRSMKRITTGFFPGFPTDAQPLLMAMATVADGTGVFEENVFENRFCHARELTRLGADIRVEGRTAVVRGVPALSGARVRAPDLRGGAALIVAGLCAAGETQVYGVSYVERGYEDIAGTLRALGARVRPERSQDEG